MDATGNHVHLSEIRQDSNTSSLCLLYHAKHNCGGRGREYQKRKQIVRGEGPVRWRQAREDVLRRMRKTDCMGKDAETAGRKLKENQVQHRKSPEDKTISSLHFF